jgi:RNA polymerase sigma-70 factor (ECF subfamily)
MIGDQVAADVGSQATRESAFRELALRHLDASYRLASVILRDPADGQDATHDAFVQAWHQWPTLRDPAKFEPWFDRILINTCRDRLRRASKRRTQDLSPELAAASGDPFTQALDRDLLGSALSELSPDHLVVVVLRFYRDLTVDEIARQVGVRPGTVNSRLHYALKRLSAALTEPGSGGISR